MTEAPHPPQNLGRFRPYPEYKNSGVTGLGVIPSPWQGKRVLRVCKRVTDGAHISPDTTAQDFPFVSTVDLQRGQIDFESCLRTSAASYGYMQRTGCCPSKGDLLFSKDGTVGRTAIVDVRREFAVASSLVILAPDPTEVEARYLDYWLNGDFIRQSLGLLLSGAALRRIAVSKVGALPVVCPSLPEQRAIAEFLDRETGKIDALVATKERLIELLQEKRTALITHAVTKGLDPTAPTKPSGIPWLGNIPAHWEVIRSRFLCDMTTGDKDTQDAKDEGEYPFFVRSDTIERLATYTFDGEAVLTSGDGAGVGKIFHHYIGKLDFHQRVYLFSNFRSVTGRFFYYFLRANLYKVVLALSAKSTVDSLRRPMLQNFPIAIGPEEEQIAITQFLDLETGKFDDLVRVVSDQIDRLKEFRTALISAAVTGKIDVREEVA